jgi:protein SCO1
MKHVSKKALRKQASRQLLYIVLGFAIGLAGLTGLVYGVMPGRASLGSPEIGGSFSMIGQDGRVVTNADLAGRPYLVFFGYTHCPDFCPTSLFDISAVFEELGPNKKVAALFVTVDPERDTPAVMKEYLSSFDKHLTGLTGDAAAVAAVAKAYRVYFKKVPLDQGGYTMDHTAIVYLMDKEGRFVAPFSLKRTSEAAAADLRRYL